MQQEKQLPEDRELLAAHAAIIAHYQQRLAKLTNDDLKFRPAGEEGWSIGQVHTHLQMGALGLFLKMAERALATEPDPAKGLNENGESVFRHDSFPPGPIKVPKKYERPVPQPENVEELNTQLAGIDARFRELAAQLETNDRGGRAAHVAFGHLRAREWLHLNTLHFRHHQKQLNRLEAALHAQPTR